MIEKCSNVLAVVYTSNVEVSKEIMDLFCDKGHSVLRSDSLITNSNLEEIPCKSVIIFKLKEDSNEN